MGDLLHLRTVSDLYRFLNLGYAEHPMIGVVDFSKTLEHSNTEIRIKTDFYSVMFKIYCRNHIRYGRKTIDFQDGSLVCIAPNHVITIDNDTDVKEDMMGWGLFFHPDLIRGTSLGMKIKDYTFFSYEISEALHLSDKEKQLLYDCILKIKGELTQNIDNFSQLLMVNNVELLLNYCSRYYSRQFITRKSVNLAVVSKVEYILKDYYSGEEKLDIGIPSVKHLSARLNLSPGYLSDLLKKETGLNAQDYIHYFVIEQAKNTLIQTDLSVSEIAYSLGFEYPQYFSRLFKQKTGKTPLEYRSNR
jgi:AraC-like DNA-binding protein